MPAQTVIKLRRDTAADWSTVDPILADGELGIETDTNRIKIGDGATEWTGLTYGPVADTAVIKVKNASGTVAIPAGTLVQFAGASGDTVTAAPAVTDGSVDFHTLIGVTAAEIAADGFGDVVLTGVVGGLNTSAYTVGTLLYADPVNAGQLTSTPPAAPAFGEPVAAVTRSGAGTSGLILVRLHIGASLNDVHDVTLTSPINGQVLQFDGTKWVNATLDALPDQTGQAGNYLTTDGTVASWGAIDLSSKANVENPSFNISESSSGYVTDIIQATLDSASQATIQLIPDGSSQFVVNSTVEIAAHMPSVPLNVDSVTDSSFAGIPTKTVVFSLVEASNTSHQSSLSSFVTDINQGAILNFNYTYAVLTEISTTEISFLDGLSSNIQAQINEVLPDTANPDNGYNFSPGSWLAVDLNSGLPVWQEGATINARIVRAINGPNGAPSSLYYPLIIQGFNGDTFQPSVTTIGYGDDSSGAYIVQKWEGLNPIPIATIKSDGSLSTLGPVASTQSVIPKSSAYTLVYEDRSQFITANGTFTITVPASVFTAGDRVDFVNIGTGVITFAAGSGFTLNSADGAVTIDTQWAGATVFFTSATTGVLIGKLA